MRQPRQYGFRSSPEDKRDKLSTPPDTILSSVDLRDGPMPAIFDQGQLGSCTANAVAACLQFDGSLDNVALGKPHWHRRSRLDIYYGERALENELDNGDTGAFGRDGFKFAQQTGVLLEDRWPYRIETYAGPPPEGYKRHKLTKPYALVTQDVDHVKAVLSNNQMIAFGFTVFASFENINVEDTGIVPMPSLTEQRVGGHEMTLVGYSGKYPNHVLARNSWGSFWGMDGYCLFPWKYLMETTLVSDLRTIVRAT